MLKQLIPAALIALSPLTAWANEDAEALIRDAATELARGDFKQDDLIETFDVQRIARFTLGKHARRVPPAELARYEQAFEDFIVGRFEKEERRFTGADIRILGSTDRNDRDSIVETVVKLPGEEPLDVRWRVVKFGEDWRVVDVEVFGLWLAIEQRAQVDAVLGRAGGGVEDAIRALSFEEERVYASN